MSLTEARRFGWNRILDVEEDAVRRARRAGKADRGVDRDVVALLRAAVSAPTATATDGRSRGNPQSHTHGAERSHVYLRASAVIGAGVLRSLNQCDGSGGIGR